MTTAPLTRAQAEAIGRAVSRQASTIYRWRKDSPALFQAVSEYAARRGITPDTADAYQAGRDATGLGISDCPFVTVGMTPEDKRLADAWIEGREHASQRVQPGATVLTPDGPATVAELYREVAGSRDWWVVLEDSVTRWYAEKNLTVTKEPTP